MCCSTPRRSKKSSRRPTPARAMAERKRVEIFQSTIQQKFRSVISEQTRKSRSNVLSEFSEIKAAILTILLMRRSLLLCVQQNYTTDNWIFIKSGQSSLQRKKRCCFSTVVRLYFDLPISGISKTQQLDSIRFLPQRRCILHYHWSDRRESLLQINFAMQISWIINVTCHAVFEKKRTFALGTGQPVLGLSVDCQQDSLCWTIVFGTVFITFVRDIITTHVVISFSFSFCFFCPKHMPAPVPN